MVDPAHAGRGVGRALGEHVLDWARGEGYRAMQFNAVVETNTRAVALWRSLGFEVLATLPEGFAHPAGGYVGLHIMYRPL
jgi:GNAT superfamily N-acetyltransferase